MGHTSSIPSKTSRRSKYSNDVDARRPKYQETIKVAQGDEPPPYSFTKSGGEGYPEFWNTTPQLPAGSRHTRVSIYPEGTHASSLNRYKDPEYLKQPLRKESREDALETLRKYDTVFIVDDSGSMQGSRWKEAKEALSGLAHIAREYDSDGLDIHFLNHSISAVSVKTSAAVDKLFDDVMPQGYTPIGEKLEELLLEYIQKLEKAQHRHDSTGNSALKRIKPVNFIVITDGSPTDDPESVIVATARRLDSGHFPLSQVGIQFVQIGNSRQATAFLKELDDALSSKHEIRDMVDTTPYFNAKLTSEMLVKVLIGGINRRVDQRGAESVMGP